MRGGFFPGSALLLLGISCGGAMTSDPDRDAAPQAAAPSATPACDCVSSTIRWWRAGGSEEVAREASIEPCTVFGYREPGLHRRCGSTMQGCGDSLGADDVGAALADPDVQAALKQAPIVYGRDLRPLGGHIDHIEVDGKVIEIGDECNDETEGCALPLGIDRFRRLLGNLQFQELANATCMVK